MGSKEESPIISPEDLSLRNENGCDRRVRPHPPPRRSGGPPGCLHPGGPAPIFSRSYPRSHVLPTTQMGTPRSTRQPSIRLQMLATGCAPLRTTPLMCDFAPIIYLTDSRERPCALA